MACDERQDTLHDAIASLHMTRAHTDDFRDTLRQLATLTYALAVYLIGVWGLLAAAPAIRLLSILLVAHALVLLAYLIHECAHNSFFASRRANQRLGATLLWLVGAGYAPYEAIRCKHLRHHADRADVITLDHRAWLSAHPQTLRIVQALEWAGVPAVDLLLRGLSIVRPFMADGPRERRGRVLLTLLPRLGLFALMAWTDPYALLGYGVAVLLFLHVLRFMDVHQHTYLVQVRPEGAPAQAVGDRAYEQRNTYSNPLSLQHPWLNALVLNFGFHNAHHVHPSTPWFALPRLHGTVADVPTGQVLPFADLLRSYHRHRVARVLHGDDPGYTIAYPSAFIGVVGVSFLVAI